MAESTRKADTVVEREIAKFLDRHLYSSDLFTKARRTDSLSEQIAGSDIVVSTRDGRLVDAVVDEKVAARYANRRLETFSLELSFLDKNGDWTEGWFLDEQKTTEYYLLGWILDVDIPKRADGTFNTELITADNIRRLQWALVERDRIVRFLKEQSYPIDRLVRIDEAIRDRGYVKTNEFINGVSFRYSNQLQEEPINILLKKWKYLELADYSGVINAR